MAPEPLDTRVVNGRFIVPDGPAISRLTIHGGRVIDDDASDVWRTVNASGHLVFPGLIQPGSPAPDAALDLVRGGTTAVLASPDYEGAACMDVITSKPDELWIITPSPDGTLSDSDWEALLGDAAVHFSGGDDRAFPVIHFLYHEGHVKRGMSLERIAAVTSANMARAAGVYPRKGSFEVGSDGDLFVFDPETQDPYRDLGYPGRVIFSLMRGQILLYNGQIHTAAGDGITLP